MSIDAMKQALESLEDDGVPGMENVKANFRAAIEAAERQEPVAVVEAWPNDIDALGILWIKEIPPEGTKLYTTPQPAIPDGWLRAVDEAMVCSHLGVADASDSYEVAKKKLNDLICWNAEVNRYFAAAPKPGEKKWV